MATALVKQRQQEKELDIEWLISLSLVVQASDCQCGSRNDSEFDPSILRHSGI
jgi:hypothetical protein